MVEFSGMERAPLGRPVVLCQERCSRQLPAQKLGCWVFREILSIDLYYKLLTYDSLSKKSIVTGSFECYFGPYGGEFREGPGRCYGGQEHTKTEF